uniref:Uncharacterized protein n=1 Tax=Phaeomonas parva TaxID=124430 RepID=A0A7S1XYI4_9STRA|mmetsp:Transcript_45462/g.142431  ORF Transcript_45462/g.142431 Transcript_45462/m.142431 type:complete len:132 (+) Transcript_45462:158-553(+)
MTATRWPRRTLTLARTRTLALALALSLCLSLTLPPIWALALAPGAPVAPVPRVLTLAAAEHAFDSCDDPARRSLEATATALCAEECVFVGLDVSKTATGYAALDGRGAVIEWGALVPPRSCTDIVQVRMDG